MGLALLRGDQSALLGRHGLTSFNPRDISGDQAVSLALDVAAGGLNRKICRTCLSETAGAARTRHGFSSDHDPDPLHRRRAEEAVWRAFERVDLWPTVLPALLTARLPTAWAPRPRPDHGDAGDPGEQSKRF